LAALRFIQTSALSIHKEIISEEILNKESACGTCVQNKIRSELDTKQLEFEAIGERIEDLEAIAKSNDDVVKARQCIVDDKWFPGVGGYAESKSSEFFGDWEYDFWKPAYGLNAALTDGSQYC
jgi:hypothetical protein